MKWHFLGHISLIFSLVKCHLHETAKISLIFAVQLILPGHLSDLCKHLTDGHHIAQNQMERYENSYLKISQRAWQNRLDVTKIGSATVRVNGALSVIYTGNHATLIDVIPGDSKRVAILA